MELTPAKIEYDDEGRLVSTAYGDIYFQPAESLNESRYVFQDCGEVGQRFANTKENDIITIAELGFGTGLNFLLSWQNWAARSHDRGWCHYIGFEKHPIKIDDLKSLHTLWPELSDYAHALQSKYPFLTEGTHRLIFAEARISLTLVFGDVKSTLPIQQFGDGVDICFLDGFAPAKNPDMWDDALWPILGIATKPDGRVTTFTAAGHVRRGLESAGFSVDKIKGYGRKREMIVGTKDRAVPRETSHKKIAVIGAGIAGCAVADALIRYGHQVHLFDKHPRPAEGTSGNRIAAIYPKLTADPSPMDRFYRHSFTYAHGFYNDLKDIDYDRCGVLHLDRNDQMIKRHTKIAARGLPKDLALHLDQSQASDAAGIDLPTGGLFYPNGAMFSPVKTCRALIERIDNQPAFTQRFDEGATSISQDENDWSVNGEAFDVVIFTGNENLRPEICDVQVVTDKLDIIIKERVRGQVTDWAGNAASSTLKTVVCHKGYLTPKLDGTHCLGATFDKGAAGTNTPSAEDHARNFEQLFEHLPHLNDDAATAESGRKGNRSATRDRIPAAGKITNGFYTLIGLGSHGFTTAPLLAEDIAAQISNATRPIDKALAHYTEPERLYD